MKDAYSFDATPEGLDVSYEKMYDAYVRVFERCGIPCRVVEAAAGAMGGYGTREFMLEAPGGEDTLLLCDACEYAANAECAKTLPPDAETASRADSRRERVDTPNARTVEQVCSMLEVAPRQLVKTLLYRAPDGCFVAAMIRGDRELNEGKLEAVSGLSPLEMASPAEIQEVTGGPLGFTGPVGLPAHVRLVPDHELADMSDFVTGANEADAHLVNVNVGADFEVADFEDLRIAVAGDTCPECRQGKLEERRGIELGHVFKLGTKYAEDMDALFTDEDGVQRPIVMGCYGIGVSRIVAAVVEHHNDDDGIIWPMAIAPFQVAVLRLDEELADEADAVVEQLERAGVDVLYDERPERPGVKFKDADLIGVPLKAVVGRATKAEGVVEVQRRATGEKEMVPLQEAAERLQRMVAAGGA
jgi:prolyl-tRNA synthetase